jgi:endoglucanase
MLAHPGLKKWMADTASQHKIPYQMEIMTFGTTDARAMQVAREGSAAGALSIPCRYVHTPSEMLSYSDVQNAVKLLVAMLSGPVNLEDGK